MTFFKNLAVVVAVVASSALALLPADASAQVSTRRGDYAPPRSDRDRDRGRRDEWDRRDDRDRRGPSVESLAKRTERESNSFRDWFERQYRQRRLGRDRDNRWLKDEVQNLDEAMERVRHRADGNSNRGRNDFEDAMAHARRIDRALVLEHDRDTRFTIREWIEFRLTLDSLARAYGVRRI